MQEKNITVAHVNIVTFILIQKKQRSSNLLVAHAQTMLLKQEVRCSSAYILSPLH